MKIIKGYNDLKTWCENNEDYKHIITEWNYEKNNELGIYIDDISPHNSARVWWTCPKGHEYFTKISARTGEKKSQCPYCSGHLFKQGYNDFETWCIENHFEDLLDCWSEKNTTLPTEVTPFKNEKIIWNCEECGYEWSIPVYSMAGKRQEGYRCLCRKCAASAGTEKRIQTILENGGSFYNWCIDNNREDVLEQWSPKNTIFPDEVTAYCSEPKIKWICKHGHEWEASVGDRRTRKNEIVGCPDCVHRYYTSFPEKVVAYYMAKYFDIEENYRPKWLGRKEIDIFIPSLEIGIEYDGQSFHEDTERDIEKDLICEENGITLIRIREYNLPELKTSLCYRVSEERNKGIPANLPELIVSILKALKIEDPDVDFIRDYSSILELVAREKEKNSLQEWCRENDKEYLLEEWHPTKNENLTPKGFTPFSNRDVWWKCSECGYEYEMSIQRRTDFGLGCKYCHPFRGSKSLFDWCHENNTLYLLDEWDYDKNEKTPKEVSYAQNDRVWWIVNGEEKYLTINQRTHYIPKKYREGASS